MYGISVYGTKGKFSFFGKMEVVLNSPVKQKIVYFYVSFLFCSKNKYWIREINNIVSTAVAKKIIDIDAQPEIFGNIKSISEKQACGSSFTKAVVKYPAVRMYNTRYARVITHFAVWCDT